MLATGSKHQGHPCMPAHRSRHTGRQQLQQHGRVAIGRIIL